MFRSLFNNLAKAGWARNIVAKWSIAWKMASRFIAGETLADGIKAIKALNDKGIYATLDHLGENTDSPSPLQRRVGGQAVPSRAPDGRKPYLYSAWTAEDLS